MKQRQVIGIALAIWAAGSSMASQVSVNWIGRSGGVWGTSTNWNPRVVPNNGADTYLVGVTDGAASVIINVSPVIDGLTIGDDDLVTLNNNLLLGVGPISNDGVLFINSLGNTTDLRVQFSTGWSGSGQVSFSNTQANRLYGLNNGIRLTNELGHSIIGSLQLGINSLALTNHGLIEATLSNGINLDVTDAQTLINDGILQASSGSQLQVVGGTTIANTGGLIRALAGSEVRLNGTTTIIGGTLGTEGDGILRNSSTLTLDAVTLDDALTINNGTLTILKNDNVLIGPLNVNSGGNSTDLRFDTTPYTLTDNALINCTNTQTNRLYGLTNGHRLIVPSAATIHGGMQLGINQMALTNHGLIDSDSSAGINVDVTDAQTLFNDGILRASNGSVLQTVGGTTIDNTGGLIQALAGSEVRLNGTTTIIGGTIMTDGTGVIRNSSTLTLDAVTLDDALTINNGTLTILKNDNVLIGPLNVNSGGNSTDLRFDTTPYTLTDNALINCTNTQANRLYGLTNTHRLVVSESATIHGGMQLGINQMALTNHGLIDSDSSAGINVDVTDAQTLINDGILQASNGSVLQTVGGTTIDNTGGLIQALAGSEVRLNGTTTIIGGTLGTEGDGILRNSSTLTLDAVTLDDALTINNGTLTILKNDNVLIGPLNVNSGGNSTDLRFDTTPYTLTDNALINCTNTQTNRLYGLTNGHRLIVPSAATIHGGMQLGINQMALTNHGLIDSDSSAGINVDVTDAQTLFNDGILRASNGSVLQTVGGTTIDNTGGLIQALAGSEVRLNGTTTIIGGTIMTDGTGVIRNSSNTQLANLTNTGSFISNNGTTLDLLGVVTNDNVISINSTGNTTDVRAVADGATLAGSGMMSFSNTQVNRLYSTNSAFRIYNGPDHTIAGSVQIGINQSRFTNQGTLLTNTSNGMTIDVNDAGDFTNEGLFHLSAGNVTVNPGPFINSGTLVIDSGRTLTRAASWPISQTGGLLEVNGTLALSSASVNVTGGTLGGNGVVNGNVSNSSGNVNPGSSAGILTVNGTYSQGAMGQFTAEVGGSDPGAGHDRLAVSSTATLAGNLTVARINGFIPNVGQEFTILTASSRIGTFDSVFSCDPINVVYTDTSVKVVYGFVSNVLGDVNGDGLVDGADLGLLLGSWGECEDVCCLGDLNQDEKVDGADLGLLLGNWSF